MTLHAGGTRVRLFPELFAGYAEPEVAMLSPPPGTVVAGPADTQLYVANAVDKQLPYAPPGYMPPYRGIEHRPAIPDVAGHFDTVPVQAPQFLAVHLYGAARHTMDIWEHYLRQPIRWWHAPAVPRLELVPVVNWPNAHSGLGFLETGTILDHDRREHLFCLNFDVVAHEIGHAVLFATVGAPAPGRMTGEYLAFHESFADLFGIVGVLRFSSVIWRLLAQTGGNLHALNMVNRLGRYSDNQQIRNASNDVAMAQLAGVRLRPDGDWDDPMGHRRNEHALSQPLTGAIFDMLVEIFQDGLASRGLVARGMDARGGRPASVARALPTLQQHFESGLQRSPEAYEAALLEARDVVGFGMAHAMHTLHPESLSFGRVAARMIEASWLLGERPNVPAIVRLFAARGIDPLPFLKTASGDVRFGDHARESAMPRCREPAAFLAARKMMHQTHRERRH